MFLMDVNVLVYAHREDVANNNWGHNNWGQSKLKFQR